ncbi:MAG: class I SAM-dependent methyltransferase [Anaerolineae bacterium]|nr:class I SAM-dependent methyltransferase [Anaerolineae bacterium]MBT3714402.1 class I SAM-dependent methyltransferase [Anaerolineae bacterium]MBT4311428.1 class I SAM-dependent methyltransferase [Anaerolineae bacterium]MBT4459155.1 class I SAM-dependent methyltransferase [Anaerolineae bacterium]MBT4841480.1 class I SAM-dependent methyltransferase [Anaerolineae bacterium]
MPTEKEVYEKYADEYERLIQREDYQGNILRKIEHLVSLVDLDVVDFGAGTGRLTRLLAPRVRSIKAFDNSAHMLEVAAKSLRKMGLSNWATGIADHRQIPVEDDNTDLIVSGWSFCYLAVWGGDNWKSALEDGLKEMRRILRPGGMIIIFETMGTGHTSPQPPEHLTEYCAWLTEAGFGSSSFRTDYKFISLQEAETLSTFFFGEEMGIQVIQKNWRTLPECTGVWWQQF